MERFMVLTKRRGLHHSSSVKLLLVSELAFGVNIFDLDFAV